MEQVWALFIGGAFGLAAAWGPIAFTSRREGKRHQAALAGTFLSECDRLLRATLQRRAQIESGRYEHDGSDASFDAILGTLHSTGYELALSGDATLQATIYDMLETARQLVFATLPALASEDERRRHLSHFTDLKIEILQTLGSPEALRRPA